MRILCIDIYNPLPINCGGDWYRYQLYSQLNKEHEFISLYTLNSTNKTGYMPDQSNLNVRWIRGKVSWKSKGLQIIRPEMLLPYTIDFEGEADLVLCTHYSYHIARKVARKCNAPIVLITHNVEWQYWKANGHHILYPLVKALETYILHKSDAVITPSARDAKTLAGMTCKDKVFYVPPTPDRVMFRADGKKFEYPQDKLNLLFYGSLDREHNVEALNELFHEIIPQLKKDGIKDEVRINIFGSGEPPRVLLDNVSEVTFHGCVDDPAEYIRGADAVIAPLSNAGGVKIRIIEALSCGQRVIASPEAVAGLPPDLVKYVEVVMGGKGFSKAIGELIRGGQARPRMGEYSIGMVRHYGIEDVVRRVRSSTALPHSGHKGCNKRIMSDKSMMSMGRKGGKPPINLRYAFKKVLWNVLFCKEAVPPNVKLGNNVHIGSGAKLDNVEMGGLITIGNDVTIADGARILCHDASSFRRLGVAWHAPVKIEDRVFVGGGAVIMPGVTLGKDSIIAAGAVVTKDVEAGTIVAGVPAQKIGYTLDLDAKRMEQLKKFPVFDYSVEGRGGRESISQRMNVLAAAEKNGGLFMADHETYLSIVAEKDSIKAMDSMPEL